MCVYRTNETIQELYDSKWLTCKQGVLCQVNWLIIWPLTPTKHKCFTPRRSPFSYSGHLYTACPQESPMLGTALQDKGCCAEENGFPNTVVSPSPADANYSLLHVNWGNISPIQRSSRDGPVVLTWEQNSLPLSLVSFFPPTTTQTGKHREVTKRVWAGKSSHPQGLSLGPGCDVKLGYEVEAWGSHYLAGRGATCVWCYWGSLATHLYN